MSNKQTENKFLKNKGKNQLKNIESNEKIFNSAKNLDIKKRPNYILETHLNIYKSVCVCVCVCVSV